MNTNIKLDETLTFYDVSANDFGDRSRVGTGVAVPCSVDASYSWESASFQELNPSSLSAWIDPATPFYVDRDGRLFGLEAQYTNELGVTDKRTWYVVTRVDPGRSIFNGELDLVMLTLERKETSGAG